MVRLKRLARSTEVRGGGAEKAKRRLNGVWAVFSLNFLFFILFVENDCAILRGD